MPPRLRHQLTHLWNEGGCDENGKKLRHFSCYGPIVPDDRKNIVLVQLDPVHAARVIMWFVRAYETNNQ